MRILPFLLPLLLLLGLFWGVAFIYGGAVGIAHHWGAFWAIAFLLLAIVTRITLPLTIGAFFGALDVWGWHWFAAFLFAVPGVALILPASLMLFLAWMYENFKGLRDNAQTYEQAVRAIAEAPAQRLKHTPLYLRSSAYALAVLLGLVLAGWFGLILVFSFTDPEASHQLTYALGSLIGFLIACAPIWALLYWLLGKIMANKIHRAAAATAIILFFLWSLLAAG